METLNINILSGYPAEYKDMCFIFYDADPDCEMLYYNCKQYIKNVESLTWRRLLWKL